MKNNLWCIVLLVFSLSFFSSCSIFKTRFGESGHRADNDTIVIVGTSFGEMTLVLYPEAHEHRKNFLKLSREHFYDSTTFHRIIKGFMIQGGDPNSKDTNPSNDGQGGPGYTIPGEFIPTFTHEKGALAAARMGDQVNPEKRSSGSQFYLVENPEGTHFLDKNYSVFGLTIKGLDVIQKIADQTKGPGDRPVKDIRMWMKLVTMKKSTITETFGYDYTTHSVNHVLIKK
jgi:cyclophilin family peptidyl-prolyl cis-trans isomerase